MDANASQAHDVKIKDSLDAIRTEKRRERDQKAREAKDTKLAANRRTVEDKRRLFQTELERVRDEFARKEADAREQEVRASSDADITAAKKVEEAKVMTRWRARERAKETKWKEEEDDGGWEAEEATHKSGLWEEAEAEWMKAVQQKPVVPPRSPKVSERGVAGERSYRWCPCRSYRWTFFMASFELRASLICTGLAISVCLSFRILLCRPVFNFVMDTDGRV